jgi:acyl-CoA reductase-like NAD-dependent aldehyde dehydrogenase
MAERLDVIKTCKLFIGGAFPRTESGRSQPIHDTKDRVIAHACIASRKDLRNAVEAARKAAAAWSDTTAYLRGQILYRMAEMLESRRDEFTSAISTTTSLTPAKARREVEASVDRLVRFAGWADKYQQVLGCQNAVAGPYYNFTIPQSTGITGVIAPASPALLGLVTLVAAPLCAGCPVVVLASETTPLPAVLFSEICATSDVPAGVVNILTGQRSELLEPMARHREIAAIVGASLTPTQREMIQTMGAENLKRIHLVKYSDTQWEDDDAVASPWNIDHFVDTKTIWHPSAT